MMTYNHWITQTKRGIGTPRSARLKAIDNALLKYYNGSNHAHDLLVLKQAIETWKGSKGNAWRNSTRNSRLEVGGKGTVETLLDEVLALSNQPNAASSTSQSRPIQSPPSYVPPPQPLFKEPKNGIGEQEKDEDNRFYYIPRQVEENSCGPACIRIVYSQVYPTKPTLGEDLLRTMVENCEQRRIRGNSHNNSSLGGGGLVRSGGKHDWSPAGHGSWLIPEALREVRPQIKCTQSTDTSALLRCTPGKPVIGVVKWSTNGGLHYVVAVRKTNSKDKLVILDPYYGVHSVPFTGTVLGNYLPKVNGTVQAHGTWYPWVCAVN